MKKRNINGIFGVIILIFILMTMQVIILDKYANNDNSNLQTENKDELSGNITFVSNRTDKSEQLNELISEFEEIHPKAKVNLELIGDAEKILEKRALVGELPDVTLVPSVIENKDFDKFFIPINDLGFSKDNIYNYSSGIGKKDQLYCLPTSMSWHGIIYNKKVFKDLGIENIPQTEDELWDICSKIKDNSIIPMVLNYKQSWVMSMWIDNIPYLYNKDFEKDMVDGDKEVLGKDSELYKSLNFANQIYNRGYSEQNLLEYDWEQCKSDIINGKAAMLVWNSDFIKQLEDMGMDKDEIGMFPIPGTNNIRIINDYRIGISKTTKNIDLCKEFLKFIFADDRYAKCVNIVPNSKNIDKENEFIEELEQYDIPIEFHENAPLDDDDESSKTYDKYCDIKRRLGIDYNLVQKYITSKDSESLRKEINEKYKTINN